MTDVVTQVRQHLADIPDLVLEATHYITPGTAPADPDARHGTTVYRIPIVAEIADLLDIREKDVEEPGANRLVGERRLGVLPTLGLWVSLVYAELEDMGSNPRQCCINWPMPPWGPTGTEHTITGETNWLSDYAEDIIELHPDFPRDIEQLWLELRKACRVRKTYTPKCPNCRCPVEAVYSGTGVGPAWWRCSGCPKTWVHDAEIQRLALTQPGMTLTQIASLLKLPQRTLYNWRDQGRFSKVGTSRHGAALFELDHVKRAVKRLAQTA